MAGETSWGALLRDGNAGRSAVVGGGMIIHAISTFVVVTILPSVVRDIGGLRYFAWSTTLYVVASLFGGALCARTLARIGPRDTYRIALGTFAAGAAICALSPAMPVLLAGRFVQGLGAGTLSALSFTMVRLLFPQPLWPRALAVISAAWGVATLMGPALGGVFAQYTGWRIGFWVLCALAPCLLALVELALPKDLPPIAAPRTPLAVKNLAVLVASVLAVSVGGTTGDPRLGGMGVLFAVVGLTLFVSLEGRDESPRLLPRGACDPTRPLGAAYAGMSLLLMGTNTEIFVPYFLQVLHGLTPLHAGYLSAVMAGGWTTGSVLSSSGNPGRTRWALLLGPASMAAGLVGLCLLMPVDGLGAGGIAAIGVGLAAIGLGIGMCWPHLGATVFSTAPEGERALAASSVTVVIMVSNAFGSAMGGLVTNLAGLTVPGGAFGARSASAWLFGLFVVSPALAAVVVRFLRRPAPSPVPVREAAGD